MLAPLCGLEPPLISECCWLHHSPAIGGMKGSWLHMWLTTNNLIRTKNEFHYKITSRCTLAWAACKLLTTLYTTIMKKTLSPKVESNHRSSYVVSVLPIAQLFGRWEGESFTAVSHFARCQKNPFFNKIHNYYVKKTLVKAGCGSREGQLP